MKEAVKNFINGLLAGILISIGGAVFLACDNKYCGAVLFSVALLCICALGYSLYTGKICYMADKYDKNAFSVLLLGLLGNLAATALCGLMIRYALPNIGEKALEACCGRLEGQTFPQTIIRAFFCGILIYLAVEIYRTQGKIFGIVFCIPVFILSGYEHSIADMFYFAASGIVSFDAFLFIMTVILGNTLGGLLIPVLKKLQK